MRQRDSHWSRSGQRDGKHVGPQVKQTCSETETRTLESRGSVRGCGIRNKGVCAWLRVTKVTSWKSKNMNKALMGSSGGGEKEMFLAHQILILHSRKPADTSKMMVFFLFSF